MPRTLRLFVPADPASLTIKPGSAIVSADEAPDESGLLRVDFEGNVYGSAQFARYADRVHHAADRHTTAYPTTARAWLRPEDLIEIGAYDPDGGQVALADEAAAARLAAWLDVSDVDADELMTGSVMRHQMLRGTRRAAVSGDPRQMAAAAWMSRRYQLGVRVPGF